MTALAATVPAASVQIVPLPAVPLHEPRDGRLNGDGFTAQVTGYRFGAQFGRGSSALRAAPGRELLVFGLATGAHAPVASIVVDGHGEVLPRPPGATPFVPVYYLASLPGRASDVALEVSREGFTQEFSFTKGERVGTQPSVLYDAATNWEVTQSFTDESTLSVLGPRGGVRKTAQQVMIMSITLTYFLPGTNTTPGSPSEAWLVLKGSTFPFYTTAQQGLPNLAYARPLGGPDLTLTLPGGKPTAATVTARGPEAHGALFNGDYYWRVPASIRLGSLRITMPPLVATAPASGAPVKFRATLSAPPVQLGFPSPSNPLPPFAGNPPPYLQGTPSGSVSPVRPTGPRLVTLLLGLVGLVAAGFVAVIARRRLGAAPVGVVARRWTGRERREDQLVKSAADVDVHETAPPGEGVATRSPSAGEVHVPERRPPLATPAATPDGVSPLPEGAMLQMVGQVRLVRLPEASTDTAGFTSNAIERPSSPASAATPTQGPGTPLAPPGSGQMPRRMLVPVPAGPPPLPEGAKELQVLGQPRLVVGLGGIVELGASELELLARLALEPGRTFSSDELRADIGAAKDADWAPTTLWTRASALRKAVGAEHVPSSSKTGGYKAVGVGTDLARFEAAVSRSKVSPDDAPRHLAEALSLVRGAPFAGASVGTFGWALDAGGVATGVANEIYDAAVKLAHLAVENNDAALAAWAVAKGRLISRDDELLDELELDAAAVSGERSALVRTWTATERRYRSRQESVPTQLVQHYRRLRERATPRD